MSQRPEQKYFVWQKAWERDSSQKDYMGISRTIRKDKDIANKLNDTFISISAAQDIDFQSVF